MKPVLKFTACILLIGIIIFASCSKDSPVNNTSYNNPPPPPSPRNPQQPLPPFPPVYDSLSGREFLYNNLVWETWGGPYVVVEIPKSHLFLNRGIEVFIDSASTWINAPFYTVEFGLGGLPIPQNNGYIYDNNYFDSVFIFAIHPNYRHLIGTEVSVKVKVL
jgi:hypothetical protein